MNHTTRMAALLGRLRREMNGAVAESMQRSGDRYGLNYGVSIPTIRTIAATEGVDHDFARFLYQQDVRELRMAALSIASPAEVTVQHVDEWFSATMPEELAEELALRLLSRCSVAVLEVLGQQWLDDASPLKCYVALMALSRAKCSQSLLAHVVTHLPTCFARFPDDLRLARGASVFVQQHARNLSSGQLSALLSLPTSRSVAFFREEVMWLIPETT